MRYNVGMKKFHVAIVGGGASGLTLACTLVTENCTITVYERGERVGRKLSATGNGQGNVTNLAASATPYFSFSRVGAMRANELVSRYDEKSLMDDLQSLGLLLIADDRGRVYPAGRQASAVTDALRFTLAQKGVDVRFDSQVCAIQKTADGFTLSITNKQGEMQTAQADAVVLCAGGNVAKQLGTDGSAYALVTTLGHTCTPLYPSLVQLKTEMQAIKTLKGIRVTDAGIRADWINEQGEKQTHSLQGDLIFTDCGVSGDGIFRISAFVTAHIQRGVSLTIDFLPTYTQEDIYALLTQKRKHYPQIERGELLCGFVNNQIARAIMKCANGDLQTAAKLVKAFPLAVKGSLGADYAQVTKGGICMDEVDDNLQSKFVDGLYFAGEILDVDGQCGGFNLQWAYSSAKAVANALFARMQNTVKTSKDRGQV